MSNLAVVFSCMNTMRDKIFVLVPAGCEKYSAPVVRMTFLEKHQRKTKRQ